MLLLEHFQSSSEFKNNITLQRPVAITQLSILF